MVIRCVWSANEVNVASSLRIVLMPGKVGEGGGWVGVRIG